MKKTYFLVALLFFFLGEILLTQPAHALLTTSGPEGGAPAVASTICGNLSQTLSPFKGYTFKLLPCIEERNGRIYAHVYWKGDKPTGSTYPITISLVEKSNNNKTTFHDVSSVNSFPSGRIPALQAPSLKAVVGHKYFMYINVQLAKAYSVNVASPTITAR